MEYLKILFTFAAGILTGVPIGLAVGMWIVEDYIKNKDEKNDLRN